MFVGVGLFEAFYCIRATLPNEKLPTDERRIAESELLAPGSSKKVEGLSSSSLTEDDEAPIWYLLLSLCD
jgi:hypothetical protein